ncbi:MAG: hypothetical protein K2N02_03300, partial [Alistipes sp.]|nr:hypothetical protein [Alistipes sp.]
LLLKRKKREIIRVLPDICFIGLWQWGLRGRFRILEIFSRFVGGYANKAYICGPDCSERLNF